MRSSIVNKIKSEEFKIDQLLDRAKHGKEWHFNNPTAQNYRRSMVPFYLLEEESNKYPMYIDNSNLAPNLTSDFKIRTLNISVSDEVHATILQDHAHAKEKKKRQRNRSNEMETPNMFSDGNELDFIISSKVTLHGISLLQTADRLIRMVEK